MCQARITLGPSFYFGDPVFSNQWGPRTLFFYALARTLHTQIICFSVICLKSVSQRDNSHII